MTLTFFSNYMNHHQRPLCDELYKKLGDDFHFVATEEMSDARKQMGYDSPENNRPYVIKTYDSQNEQRNFGLAKELANESDVVILGSAPEKYLEQRLKQNKLTFRYCERFFKTGKWHLLDPRVLFNCYHYHFKYRKSNLYLLCASAYTALDSRFIYSYPNKAYRWGYFPKVVQYENIESVIEKKEISSILWVGRFLKLKHAEDVIFLAEKLKAIGESFSITVIGEGEKENRLRDMILKKGVQDFIQIFPFMTTEQVRMKMEQADIFLFTSDRNEGWGAVLNEAMNSACAVVANNEIGSVPYLIRNGQNGIIYHRKKKNDLYEKVKFLLSETKKKRRIQISAYQTMIGKWNAEIAALRLLHLIDCIQKGVEVEYSDGPCSKDRGKE